MNAALMYHLITEELPHPSAATTPSRLPPRLPFTLNKDGVILNLHNLGLAGEPSCCGSLSVEVSDETRSADPL